MRLRKILPIALAAISAFVALSAWAFASPPGSAPDDDFHLPAIWCSHGAVEGIVNRASGVTTETQVPRRANLIKGVA